MQASKSNQELQNFRQEIRNLLHDTLAQSLFSASTLSSILSKNLADDKVSQAKIVLELDILLKDAVNELKSIQALLSNEN